MFSNKVFDLVGVIRRDLSALQKLVGVVQPLTQVCPVVVETLGILEGSVKGAGPLRQPREDLVPPAQIEPSGKLRKYSHRAFRYNSGAVRPFG